MISLLFTFVLVVTVVTVDVVVPVAAAAAADVNNNICSVFSVFLVELCPSTYDYTFTFDSLWRTQLGHKGTTMFTLHTV